MDDPGGARPTSKFQASIFTSAADAAEAVCFAVLAHETLHGNPTNIPTVTGAKRSAVLGKIVPGRKMPNL
jgi:1,6-anhydro-N-acetylmuramate kinase